MCRIQAAEDTIGDDADAPDANGLSDAAGVIAVEEEVALAEKAPVEEVADEAVVEVPHGTSIDLSSDSPRLPTPRPCLPPHASLTDQLVEMAVLTDAEEGAADEEADIAPNVVQEVVDADFWSTRVSEDTHKGMEGIMANNLQVHGLASDVDIKSVHSDSVELGEGAASDVFLMSANGDSVELNDADGHLSVMIQVFV